MNAQFSSSMYLYLQTFYFLVMDSYFSTLSIVCYYYFYHITYIGDAERKRFQRVEILKIAEPCPLIDPSQVVVTQGEILVADPVLTPIGREAGIVNIYFKTSRGQIIYLPGFLKGDFPSRYDEKICIFYSSHLCQCTK